MQWSLVAAFIPIVNILWCGASALDCNYTSSLLKLGYSKECIDSSRSSLISCSNDEAPPYKECCPEQENITNTLMEVNNLLQGMKSAEENSSSVVKALLQEMKSDREILESKIEAIRLGIESEGENSSSVVKNLLQEMQSEIKAIRQEMKSAEMNSSSVFKSLLQKIMSDGENSSSVVKNLLQEMQSEIKAICQEIKSEGENSSSGVKTTAAPEGKELPTNCAELKEQGETSSGVQTVYPYVSYPKQVAYCDQVTDGGGWTVIQSRSPLPIRENFKRKWDEYVEGFGDPKGEFWIGLDNIHALTNHTQMHLRIDLEDAEGEKRWAQYATFHVGDASSEYVLRIGGYTGDAGDGMTDPSDKDYNLNNMKFSTHDNDNDLSFWGNCAEGYKGGWWFNRCSLSHLNGLPFVGEAPWSHGIHWSPFHRSHSLKKASMKLRPVSLGF